MFVTLDLDEISFWNVLETFLLVHYFQIILNDICNCQSVTWLTCFMKLDNYSNISSSGWDIFLKCFGDIPGMLVHYFQIIPNFLYVCQSVSWLTHLLKLDKYRDISSSAWDIFLNLFGDISWMLVHYFQIIQNFLYACQSVIWLISYWNKAFNSISKVLYEIFSDFFGGIPMMSVY